MSIEPFLAIALIAAIIVGLPCLLVRPLLVAIADRIAGRKSSAREIDEMKKRLSSLETEVRAMRVQVIGLESSQEYSTKLLEGVKEKLSESDSN